MLEIGWFSTKLFFKGKMLRDPIYFFQQIGIGFSISLLLLMWLSQTSIPFWGTIAISSFIPGSMMPFLLKDFKIK
ncbi:hypothetical protein [Mastigocoleus testarum]|uniref:Uncharacterized protein n=1 Tax=Mastigocoleus testarum BC008 TaxID=371196 RepID=A0A0V7ZE23_9CYAN|nr:hypothetical protein [Mastigocoleus testarum]KST62820.1 hypothetical protein BC008_10865 [Mastigocoleus testarum BC008]KST62872.1 hypothetical protein BC008_11150 [Mastigocoleus testarum BC008]MDJ0775593.1 hypothetical protein [Mastigocoleus sp. MO_167.B18]